MLSNEARGTDRRDFIQTSAVATAAALSGCVSAENQLPADALSILKNLQMLDLSVAIEHDAPGELAPPKVEYLDHASGGESMQSIFDCAPEDLVFSGGRGWVKISKFKIEL